MRTTIYTSIIFFLLNLSSYSQSGWYEQTLPVSGTIYDIEFLNSNTGFISISTPAILKTTNGGAEWNVLNNFRAFDIDIIDSMTVYSTGRGNVFEMIYRTFDLGLSWDSVALSNNFAYRSIHFFNRDTGLVSSFTDPNDIILRTTNGGISLQNLSTTTGFGILFFLKEKKNGEYYGWNLSHGYMSKTTNSGFAWTTPTRTINGVNGDFNSLFFLNSDTGWVGFDPQPTVEYKIFRTNNGGVNWVEQRQDNSPIPSLYFCNNDKGWAGYDIFRILATTNGGLNWGTQTSPIFGNVFISFTDCITGWTGNARLSHTTDGGGIITYVGIDPSNTEIPSGFELKQNYPNPFNPQTTIEFSIKQNSSVSMILYDILGKEVTRIYNNENLSTGNYKAVLDFSKKDMSSGTYFYTLKVSDKNSKQLYLETKRMIFVK